MLHGAICWCFELIKTAKPLNYSTLKVIMHQHTNTMSTHVSTNAPQVFPLSHITQVRLTDGTIATVKQLATYQINPATGNAELVLNSLRYVDVFDNEVENVASLVTDATPRPAPRTFFWKVGAPSLYQAGDTLYDLLGNIYTGPIDGYQSAPNSGELTAAAGFSCCPTPVPAWVKYDRPGGGFQYLPITDTQEYDTDDLGNATNVIIHEYRLPDGGLWAGTEPVVYALPPERFQSTESLITAGQPQVISANYPISSVALAATVPFPTKEHPETSAVYVDGLPQNTAYKEYDLAGHTDQATVNPPAVTAIGNAFVSQVIRQRIEPILIDAVPVAVTAPVDPTGPIGLAIPVTDPTFEI